MNAAAMRMIHIGLSITIVTAHILSTVLNIIAGVKPFADKVEGKISVLRRSRQRHARMEVVWSVSFPARPMACYYDSVMLYSAT